MAGGTIGAGANPTYTGTVTTGGTAEQTTFADRYGYVNITNDGSTIMYATTNGTTAAAGGSGVYAINPGTNLTIANQLPYWDQSSSVLLPGVEKIPTGGGTFSETTTSPTVLTSPSNPGRVHPMMGSMMGNIGGSGYVNPGVKVSIFSATTSAPYTIVGAG